LPTQKIFFAGSQAPAWEPLSCKLLLGRSLGSWSFKSRIPKQELGNEQTDALYHQVHEKKGDKLVVHQALVKLAGYRPWPGFRHPCRNDGFCWFGSHSYNKNFCVFSYFR